MRMHIRLEFHCVEMILPNTVVNSQGVVYPALHICDLKEKCGILYTKRVRNLPKTRMPFDGIFPNLGFS